MSSAAAAAAEGASASAGAPAFAAAIPAPLAAVATGGPAPSATTASAFQEKCRDVYIQKPENKRCIQVMACGSTNAEVRDAFDNPPFKEAQGESRTLWMALRADWQEEVRRRSHFICKNNSEARQKEIFATTKRLTPRPAGWSIIKCQKWLSEKDHAISDEADNNFLLDQIKQLRTLVNQVAEAQRQNLENSKSQAPRMAAATLLVDNEDDVNRRRTARLERAMAQNQGKSMKSLDQFGSQRQASQFQLLENKMSRLQTEIHSLRSALTASRLMLSEKTTAYNDRETRFLLEMEDTNPRYERFQALLDREKAEIDKQKLEVASMEQMISKLQKEMKGLEAEGSLLNASPIIFDIDSTPHCSIPKSRRRRRRLVGNDGGRTIVHRRLGDDEQEGSEDH